MITGKYTFDDDRRDEEPILEIKNLCKSYKMYRTELEKILDFLNIKKIKSTNQIINDFSLNLYPGDKLGIVGRNGSGKTTVLKLIAGMIFPDSGEVKVKG